LYLLVLEEAEQLVRGERTTSAALRSDVEQMMIERWSKAPETQPYDHAIFLAKRQGQDLLRFPRPLLARGQRLAELGRFDEARVDFDKAVERAPEDWQVQLARATFLADCGQWEAAGAAFGSLLHQTGGDRWWLEGRRIEEEIVAREPLLDRLQAGAPNAAIWWRLRGCRRIREQRWEEAATAFTSGDPYWSHYSLAATLHLMLGDHAAYNRNVQEMEQMLDEQIGTGPMNSVHRGSVRSSSIRKRSV
jgi:tetratricopeptide (TPR) repeat protein